MSIIDTFQFLFPTKVIFGNDKVNDVGQVCKNFGKHVLVLTGSSSARKSGHLAKVLKSLEEADNFKVSLYEGVANNPTVSFVDELAGKLNETSIDVIVAIGGGSVIDTAKILSLVLLQGGSCWDYINVPERPAKKIGEKVIPLVAIPTTAGTGSEATPFAVVTNAAAKMKKGMGSVFLYPKVSIIDPTLLASTPRQLSAFTGCDALGQALEAYTSGKANLMTDTISLAAIKLLVENLPTICQNGNDLAARGKVAWGAMLSGLAIGMIDVNLAHAMSHPLSANYDIHHGLAVGILTSVAVEHNYYYAQEKYDTIKQIFLQQDNNVLRQQLSCAEIVKNFYQQLDIPLRLRDVGVPLEELPKLAQEAMQIGAIRTNICEVSYDTVLNLYKKVW